MFSCVLHPSFLLSSFSAFSRLFHSVRSDLSISAFKLVVLPFATASSVLMLLGSKPNDS